ncbi:MAG TPA: 5-formyltetrahydrofolate cyclo-ligase [Mycobacteriales bacterium]|nr:5-formyltetrahydrofolate cyclo-ligase [Mycobacteriales bacterium]
MSTKEELRRFALERRSARSVAEIRSSGAALAGRASAIAVRAQTVAAFLSTPTEPPTRQLLAALIRAGCEVIVPVVVGEQMDWARYTAGVATRTTALGVEEPIRDHLGPTALHDADVALVPALLVDRTGNRLGRGRGYYDRALADITVRTLAVVFDDELVEELPAEPHDRRVSGVLRPAGLLEF